LHEAAICKARGLEFRDHIWREKPTERAEAEPLLAAGERVEGDEQPFPAVVMLVPCRASYGAIAQSTDRVAFRIEFAPHRNRIRRMQQIAVFGCEQKNEPVNETQELTEKLRQR